MPMRLVKIKKLDSAQILVSKCHSPVNGTGAGLRQVGMEPGTSCPRNKGMPRE